MGTSEYNLRIAKNGDLNGTYTYDNSQTITRIDGAVYATASAADMSQLMPHLEYLSLPDDGWVRLGSAGVNEERYGVLPSASPAATAETIQAALEDPGTDFAPDPIDDDSFSDLNTDSPAEDTENTMVEVGDVRAWVASTPRGRIYVSPRSAHRAGAGGGLPGPGGCFRPGHAR
ncbi:hypothetical protein [Kineosporia babensis]|uniref:Uncharacterized protein n=1 Tax=Kineosporia babensis TaxID=499548 RepID=A0A9X1NJ30_9ACTN|nr:hypothetical protein [Kineosporia babensis]MCD5314990.1 hypothetical protein [Kineosporia babensis]